MGDVKRSSDVRKGSFNPTAQSDYGQLFGHPDRVRRRIRHVLWGLVGLESQLRPTVRFHGGGFTRSILKAFGLSK
jgi:hypothetical protein